MVCPNCQANIADNLMQCNNCGGNVAVTVAAPDGRQFGPYPIQSLRQYQSDGRIGADWHASVGGTAPVPVHQLLAWTGAPPVPTPAVTPPTPQPVAPPQPPPPTPIGPGMPAGPPVGAPRPTGKKKSSCWAWVIGCGAAFLIAVGILAALLAPVYKRARAMAIQVVCEVYLEEIAAGTTQYLSAHNGVLFSADAWQEELKSYVDDEELFKCPETGKTYQMNPALAGQNVQQIAAGERTPDTIPLLYDAGFPNGEPPHPEGWEVCFLDGSCRVVSKKQAAHYSGE